LETDALFIRIVTVLSVLLALSGPAVAQTVGGPVLVFDAQTGEVLSQERAGEPWYPASLTKLMTAYIVFQKIREGKLRLDQQIYVSSVASGQEPSKIGIPAGKTVSVDFALQALLIYSANDMAYVLAEGAAGTVDAFVREMNATAEKLGMTGTRFANPNGLFDPRQITTARDIAILATALLKTYPERAHYFSQDAVAIGKRRLPNRNSLLRQMKAADGMKTGFVCNSGFNLVATATIDGRRLGAVIFGASRSCRDAAGRCLRAQRSAATPAAVGHRQHGVGWHRAGRPDHHDLPPEGASAAGQLEGIAGLGHFLWHL
jgi:D-alanyl-D-alanine carboxypeptidase